MSVIFVLALGSSPLTVTVTPGTVVDNLIQYMSNNNLYSSIVIIRNKRKMPSILSRVGKLIELNETFGAV